MQPGPMLQRRRSGHRSLTGPTPGVDSGALVGPRPCLEKIPSVNRRPGGDRGREANPFGVAPGVASVEAWGNPAGRPILLG